MKVAAANELFAAIPDIGEWAVDIASGRHPYVSWSFEVASRFLENTCTPANKVKVNFHQSKSWRRTRKMELQLHSFFISALHGGRLSSSTPLPPLTPGKNAPVPTEEQHGWTLQPIWAVSTNTKISCLFWYPKTKPSSWKRINNNWHKMWGEEYYINRLKTKCRLTYIKTQFVPRSKHFSSRL